jgi:hypothetical protein
VNAGEPVLPACLTAAWLKARAAGYVVCRWMLSDALFAAVEARFGPRGGLSRILGFPAFRSGGGSWLELAGGAELPISDGDYYPLPQRDSAPDLT